MQTAPINSSEASHVATDLECRRCGYNLRSLAWDAVCTECGTAVEASRQPANFPFASLADARRTVTAARMAAIAVTVLASSVIVGIVFNLLITVWAPALVVAWSRTILNITHYTKIAGLGLQLVATWLLLMPRVRKDRRPLRFAAITLLSLSGIVAAMPLRRTVLAFIGMSSPRTPFVMAGISILMYLAAVLGLGWVLMELRKRVGGLKDSQLQRSYTWAMLLLLPEIFFTLLNALYALVQAGAGTTWSSTGGDDTSAMPHSVLVMLQSSGWSLVHIAAPCWLLVCAMVWIAYRRIRHTLLAPLEVLRESSSSSGDLVR